MLAPNPYVDEDPSATILTGKWSAIFCAVRERELRMRSRSTVAEQFLGPTVGAADDDKATGVTTGAGVSALAG